jgi:hypothetical protein
MPLWAPGAVILRSMNGVTPSNLIGPIYTVHTVVILIDSEWDIKPLADSVPKDWSHDLSINKRQGRTFPQPRDGLRNKIGGGHP